MGQQYDNTNRGAMFKNKKKTPGDNRPDYTGKLDVGGKEYFLSGWLKKSRAGDPYMSLAVQVEGQQGGNKPGGQQQPPKNEPLNSDDIPF